MIPRLGEAADWPRYNQAGTSRTVKRDGRTAAPGGEMGHGGIGADIDGGTLEQGCQARPVETPAHADYRRVGGPPRLSMYACSAGSRPSVATTASPRAASPRARPRQPASVQRL